MKAIFVAPSLNVGGFERQWSLLVPGLTRRGLSVEVFTLDGTGRFFEELADEGIPSRCLKLSGSMNVPGAVRAAGVLASRRPDVVLSTGTSAHVVGQLTCFRSDARHVAAVHSIPEHRESFTCRRRLLVRAVAPRVAASTAVTTAQLDFVRALGFDPSRTRVIPNGVAPASPSRSRDDVRGELGVGPAAFVAMLIASLRPEKRVERFVAAVTAANRLNSAIRGVVVGTGTELPRVRELGAASGVVSVLGHRADTPDLIAAADVICLTSDAEALPLIILEAMAGARPVVASDVGGVRDAVVEGETGFLLAADDSEGYTAALLALAGDPDLAGRLGEAGRRRQQERFTVDGMVDAHCELFEEVRRREGRRAA